MSICDSIVYAYMRGVLVRHKSGAKLLIFVHICKYFLIKSEKNNNFYYFILTNTAHMLSRTCGFLNCGFHKKSGNPLILDYRFINIYG